MAQFGFNVAEVEPQTFETLPAGDYICEVVDSEMKETRAGTGQYLQLTLKVLQGNFAGRLLWDRLNVINPNEQAQNIGRQVLSALCHAAGKPNAQDSQQLHGIPVSVKVVAKDDPQRGLQNEVKGYKSAGVSTPAMQQAPAPSAMAGSPAEVAQAQAQAQSPAAPSWGRPEGVQ